MKNKIFAMIVFMLFIVGCSRDESNKPQGVSFEVPMQKSYYLNSDGSAKTSQKIGQESLNKISAQSNSSSDLTHVVINVSASDVGSIFCSFDVQRNKSSGPCTFDASDKSAVKVGLEIANGSSRLFQVGLAFEDSSSDGKISLVYGDSVADISASSSAVAISVAESLSGGEGHIRGRYLSGSNVGPTGTMEVKIKPRSNRPSLTIMKTEMINGWFEAFSMDGIPFEYSVNGELLWGQPMQKANFQSYSGVGSRHQVIDFDSGYEVFGFFGSEGNTNGLSSLYPGSCTDSIRFNSCLDIDSGYRGPFKTSGNFFSSSGVLSWNFLPSMEGYIEGVSIFKISNDVFESKYLEIFESDDLINCTGLNSVSGITNLGNKSISESSLALTILKSDGSSVGTGATFAPSSEKIILCPYGKSGFYRSALILPLDNDSESSQPYLRLEINAQYDSSLNRFLVRPNECYTVTPRLYLYDQTSSTASFWTVPSGRTLSGSLSTGSNYAIYSNSSCSSSISQAALNFASGSSLSNSFYVKFNTIANDQVFNSINLSGTDESVQFYPIHNRLNVTYSASSPNNSGSSSSSGVSKLVFSGNQVINEGSCSPITIHPTDSNGNIVGLSAGQSIQFYLTTTIAAGVFVDSGCSAGISANLNINLNNANPSYQFWVKSSNYSSLPSIPLKATIDSSSFSGLTQNQEFNFNTYFRSASNWTQVTSGIPSYINLSSSCLYLSVPFYLRKSDYSAAGGSPTVTWSISSSSSNSNFYPSNNATCSGASTLTSYQFSSGTGPAANFKHGLSSPGFIKLEMISSELASDVKFYHHITVLDNSVPTKVVPSFTLGSYINQSNLSSVGPITPSSCIAVRLSLVNDVASATVVPNTTGYQLSSAIINEFYSDSGCGTAYSYGGIIPLDSSNGNQPSVIYYRPNATYGTNTNRNFNLFIRPVVSGGDSINSYLSYPVQESFYVNQ